MIADLAAHFFDALERSFLLVHAISQLKKGCPRLIFFQRIQYFICILTRSVIKGQCNHRFWRVDQICTADCLVTICTLVGLLIWLRHCTCTYLIKVGHTVLCGFIRIRKAFCRLDQFVFLIGSALFSIDLILLCFRYLFPGQFYAVFHRGCLWSCRLL